MLTNNTYIHTYVHTHIRILIFTSLVDLSNFAMSFLTATSLDFASSHSCFRRLASVWKLLTSCGQTHRFSHIVTVTYLCGLVFFLMQIVIFLKKCNICHFLQSLLSKKKSYWLRCCIYALCKGLTYTTSALYIFSKGFTFPLWSLFTQPDCCSVSRYINKVLPTLT